MGALQAVYREPLGSAVGAVAASLGCQFAEPLGYLAGLRFEHAERRGLQRGKLIEDRSVLAVAGCLFQYLA